MLAILLLACSFAASPCNQTNEPLLNRVSTGTDELTLKNDATATVTGVVLENNRGCRVDAPCYLQVRVRNGAVRIIYHPGQGKEHLNKAAYLQGSTVSKGARITAYGRYSKKGRLDMIGTFSCDDF